MTLLADDQKLRRELIDSGLGTATESKLFALVIEDSDKATPTGCKLSVMLLRPDWR